MFHSERSATEIYTMRWPMACLRVGGSDQARVSDLTNSHIHDRARLVVRACPSTRLHSHLCHLQPDAIKRLNTSRCIAGFAFSIVLAEQISNSSHSVPHSSRRRQPCPPLW